MQFAHVINLCDCVYSSLVYKQSVVSSSSHFTNTKPFDKILIIHFGHYAKRNCHWFVE